MNEKHQEALEQQLQLLSEQSKADGVDPVELTNLTYAMIQVVSELEQANFVLTSALKTEEDADDRR
ncbi:hypothetical protein [Secundilactobacillus similis]|uniref:Uncharacterized protein n=1 Tax=Secundilactobacillus similis DSM 23365 = JCM 2765 TaxID=1423804 RepID=A0A0R2EW52_9LACO|nr:hypothetical protein [Secundilactobacillus similis]KRN20624.1 hypothetical protein FD14_GL001410 [Secundilactobacillus similis DSM 23365 = JCM 2765]